MNERNSNAVQMMADGFGACVELANSRSSSKQKCKLVPLNPVTYSLLQRPALEFLNQVSSLSRICWHPQGILHTYLVAILTFSQVSTKPGSLRQQSFRKYFLSGRSSKKKLKDCPTAWQLKFSHQLKIRQPKLPRFLS